MPAADNGKVQLIQGGNTLNFVTGATITFNSTQQPAISSVSTAVTSSLAGGIAGLNTLGGAFNDLKSYLINVGLLPST